MITSIKHPLVFVTLVLADVFENAFCLWSLSRSKASRSSTVVPIEEDGTSTNTKSSHEKKSLTKRSSSVFALAKDLREVKDEVPKALHISAIRSTRDVRDYCTHTSYVRDVYSVRIGCEIELDGLSMEFQR